jgi:hypothetical protein
VSDWLDATCAAAPLTRVIGRSLHSRPDRQITAGWPGRRALSATAPESPDRHTFAGEGHCLDSRSSPDLTSGGDLSKAHPNYQTPTRGQAMQVVTRGRRGNGKTRCRHPPFAWATTPMRLATTPGHARWAGRKAPDQRIPRFCHERRRHRFPQDPGFFVPAEGRSRARSWRARPSRPLRVCAAAIVARASGTTYPLSAGAVGDMTPPWHRYIRW